MKASVAKGVLTFIMLGMATSAYAHKLKQVRSELSSQGYEQIEFKRTKFPVWVNACREGARYHLHVDWYGKIKKKTRTGSCPTEAEYTDETAAEPISEPRTTKTEAGNENSTISPAMMEADETVETEAEPKTSNTVDCKKFFPAIGRSLTVPCE